MEENRLACSKILTWQSTATLNSINHHNLPLNLSVYCDEILRIGLLAHSAKRRKLPKTPWFTSLIIFYCAMLCIRGTSHGPVSVSVCLSVTSRSSTKTTKRRITQITPHYSPGTVVFWCERSPRNSTGVTPYEGAECRWGGSISATFDE